MLKQGPHQQTSLPIANAIPLRPIHFIGGKSRLVEDIYSTVKRIVPEGSLVLDPFAGTGAVSARLSLGFRVFASDIQEFSRILTNAQILPPPVNYMELVAQVVAEAENRFESILSLVEMRVLEEERRAISDEGASLAKYVQEGYHLNLGATPFSSDLLSRLEQNVRQEFVITRLYGGLYFGLEQSLRMDCLSQSIKLIPGQKRDWLLAPLISCASALSSTVGNQFAQPIMAFDQDGKLKTNLLRKMAKYRRIDPISTYVTWSRRYASVSRSEMSHSVATLDFRDSLNCAPVDAKLIYADPPYTRDHYSRYYHVLETIARQDYPQVAQTIGTSDSLISRAAYRSDRHQSPFSIKSKVESAFEFLAEAARAREIPLLLSYSRLSEPTTHRSKTRMLSVDEITDLFVRSGLEVSEFQVRAISHSKLNSKSVNALVDQNAEVLLLAAPK